MFILRLVLRLTTDDYLFQAFVGVAALGGRKFVEMYDGLLRRQNVVNCCTTAFFVTKIQIPNSSLVQAR